MKQELPTTLPPGQAWMYARCIDGPLAGEIKDIPAHLTVGTVVRWEAGHYMVGLKPPGNLLMRWMHYVSRDE